MGNKKQILYRCAIVASIAATAIIPTNAGNVKGNKPIELSIDSTNIDSITVRSILTYPFRNQYKDPQVDKLVEYARQYTGRPYRYGSKGPHQFDCSGFTSYVFRHISQSLNASSSGQYQQGISIKKSDIRRGDLVFFRGRNARRARVGHVGMVTEVFEDGTFQFIHASIKGIREDHSTKSYYAQRYVGARRIISPTIPYSWFLDTMINEESEEDTPFALD